MMRHLWQDAQVAGDAGILTLDQSSWVSPLLMASLQLLFEPPRFKVKLDNIISRNPESGTNR